MHRIALAPYILRIVSKGNPTENLPLSNFGNGFDFYKILSVFLGNLGKLTKDKKEKRAYTVPNFYSDRENRRVSGIIEVGMFGQQTKVRDTEEGHIAYETKLTDAVTPPFYFLFSIPKNENEGILILQKTGAIGVKTAVEHALNIFFNSQYKDFKVIISQLVPTELVNEYLSNGALKSLRLIKFGKPTGDIADFFRDGQQEIYTEYVISVSQKKKILGADLTRIMKVVNNELPLNQLIQIENFDYQNIKVEIESNGQRKTIDFQNLFRLQSHINISNKIQVDSTGHPNFASIHQEGMEFLMYLEKSISWRK